MTKPHGAMAQNGGLTSMKKKFLLTVIPALMILSSCAGAGPKQEMVQLEPEMVEDTLAHEELFGQGGKAVKLTPYKDPDPSDPSLKKPVVGVQYKADGEGRCAVRYVAAIAALDVEATWTRGICNKNGVQQQTADDKFVNKVVTTAYDAVSADSDSGAPYVVPGDAGSGFNYFVVYTLRNIPVSQVDSYLFAYLTLEKGGDSVTSKAVISRIGGGNSFAYDVDGNTNYFLQGTINGVADTIQSIDFPGSGTNFAEKEDVALAANDSFGLFKVASDHFQCFGYDQLRRGAPFLPRVAANNYIKVNAAGNYNLYLTNTNEIHIVVPDAAKDTATYYLKPNANWIKDGARFAAYFFNTSESLEYWADMADAGDGFYSVNKPSGNYAKVIFCRMDGAQAENIWGNKWNQTADLLLDDNGNTYFINDGSWDEGNWNTHAA